MIWFGFRKAIDGIFIDVASMVRHFLSLLNVLIFSSCSQIWNKPFINIPHNSKTTERVGIQEVS